MIDDPAGRGFVRRLMPRTHQAAVGIKAAVGRKRDPLRGTAEIALAVGEGLNTYKMKKHFDLDITDVVFSFARKTAEIAAEEATDGLYVVRTSLPEATLDDAATVRSYKSLAVVERAFRCIKTVDLQVRPVHHWLADRVRAHVFLCMLAYYLEWHMRQRLPLMVSIVALAVAVIGPGTIVHAAAAALPAKPGHVHLAGARAAPR